MKARHAILARLLTVGEVADYLRVSRSKPIACLQDW